MCKLFCERLLAERKRLGFTQDEMAAYGGVAKRTYCNYESGEREPPSGFLSAVAAHGVDLQYVLLGLKSPKEKQTSGIVLNEVVEVHVTPEEAALLDNYRNADELGKQAIQTTGAALAQPKKGALRR